VQPKNTPPGNESPNDDPLQLIRRISAGDFSAYESFYDRYHQLIYTIAMRILEHEASAEDVTQEVFMNIWTNPQHVRAGNIAGRIARTARDRSIDFLRARGLRADAELPDVSPVTSTLDDAIFANIEPERVSAALAALSEEERSLIVEGFFSGVTHEELARRTGLTLDVVKRRIRSGLGRFCAALGEGEDA
jgi:RNA polymerase sigma-70 factor (ECF subfamily)